MTAISPGLSLLWPYGLHADTPSYWVRAINRAIAPKKKKKKNGGWGIAWAEEEIMCNNVKYD